MTSKFRAQNHANLPTLRQRLRTLDELGAPTFHMIACPDCGAEPPYICDPAPRGAQAHRGRIDAAMRIAYRTRSN